ncbi:MAG TPA: DUF1295 domain-containing protein [Flavipsychrobacter sp.]|jgi:hypothetical protein|nr:DUF1295 domain-containing protein [Flavipsychrobacter sp.]
MTLENFTLLLWIWIAIAVIIFFTLLFITAPYGRHSTTTWGPLINNKLAWFLMEFFVLVVFVYFILIGSLSQTKVNFFIMGLFILHYVNRSFIFPLRIKTKGKKMPIVIMLMGLFFNLCNGFFLGYYLGEFKAYSIDWMYQPQFIVGLFIFFLGMGINWWADTVLIHLRKPKETDYKIPQQGLFKFISCPNLFGEVIEWCGFAILTWSLPGLAFFIWTFANLVPRAMAHHQWYKSKFPEYPKSRKAIFPFIF